MAYEETMFQTKIGYRCMNKGPSIKATQQWKDLSMQQKQEEETSNSQKSTALLWNDTYISISSLTEITQSNQTRFNC